LFELAPPDSQLALPTVAVLRVLVPGGVFDGWERVETNDAAHLMTTDERDHFMADECHRRGIALVSRDKNARTEEVLRGLDPARAAQGLDGGTISIGRGLELDVTTRTEVEELRDALAKSKRTKLEAIAPARSAGRSDQASAA
jgi:hypothetical protein